MSSGAICFICIERLTLVSSQTSYALFYVFCSKSSSQMLWHLRISACVILGRSTVGWLVFFTTLLSSFWMWQRAVGIFALIYRCVNKSCIYFQRELSNRDNIYVDRPFLKGLKIISTLKPFQKINVIQTTAGHCIKLMKYVDCRPSHLP